MLVSGYLIPTLLRVSQVSLAAGLNPLFMPHSRSTSRDVSDQDFSVDRGSIDKPGSNKLKIEEDYFSGYNNQFAKSSIIQNNASRAPRKSRYLALVIPYLSLIGSLACFGIIALKLVLQIISVFKS